MSWIGWIKETLHRVHSVSGGGTAGSMLFLICAITLFLKLTSWAHVHHDLRLADRESAAAPIADLDAKLAKFASSVADTDGERHAHYPSNVTACGLLYFVAAPTLCYQAQPHCSSATVAVVLLSLLG